VDYIKHNWAGRAVVFAITTNGTLLTEPIIRFLRDHQFRLSVSLDGPKSVHDRWRVFVNQKGSFERVMKNLERVRDHDRDYFVRMVSFLGLAAPPYDLGEVSQFFSSHNLFDHCFPRQLRYGHVNVTDTDLFDGSESRLSRSAESIQLLWKQYFEYVTADKPFDREIWLAKALFDDSLPIIHNRPMCPLPKRCYPNGICVPGKRKLFVSCDGRFYMCERVGYALPVGDIGNGFDVDKINNLIAEYCSISTRECCNCWAIRLCDACFVRAQKGDRLDVLRKNELCSIYRERMEWFLRNYCRILERNPKALDFLRDA